MPDPEWINDEGMSCLLWRQVRVIVQLGGGSECQMTMTCNTIITERYVRVRCYFEFCIDASVRLKQRKYCTSSSSLSEKNYTIASTSPTGRLLEHILRGVPWQHRLNSIEKSDLKRPRQKSLYFCCQWLLTVSCSRLRQRILRRVDESSEWRI